MNKRVLITGASGFIGKNLLIKLLEKDYDVICVSSNALLGQNFPSLTVIPIKSHSPDSIHFVKSQIVGPIDAVINLAAYGLSRHDNDAEQFQTSNVLFAKAFLVLAVQLKAKCFISAGSVSEYAAISGKRLLNEDDELSTSLYGASKASFAKWGCMFAKRNHMSFYHLRFFNVYGPGESSGRLIPYLLSKFSSGQTASLTDGEQVRDFIHVDDIVSSIEACLSRPSKETYQGVYNVCTGVGTKVRELIETLALELGISENLLEFGAIKRRDDEIMWAVGDNSRLKEVIDWEPKVSVFEGIKRVVQAYGKK